MLSEYLGFAVQMAREAGEVLRENVQKPKMMDQKSSRTDLVTETDREVEKLIVQRIQAQYPTHHILGEEGSNIGEGNFDYRWVIDPIDGTTNFAQGLPHFSVSIALTAVDGLPIVGVVYDPMRDELFSATKGGGTFLNDQPIHTSQTQELSQAVVASGFPYDKWTDARNNTNIWSHFVVRTRGIRRLGSAALDLAYVACGRVDGYWEQKLNPWDMMAGWLLIIEAGGTVTDYDGQQAGLLETKPKVIASNGHIHAAMLQVFQEGANAPRPS